MNLVIAVQQFAAIIDVWHTHRATAREGDGTRRTEASARIATAGIRAANSAILIVDAVASRDAIPEVDQIRIGTRAIQLQQFRLSQHPDADAIAIRDPVRLAI